MRMLVCKVITGWTQKSLPCHHPSPGTLFFMGSESLQHFLGCSARWCCCPGFREEFVSWSSADGPRRRINAYSVNVHCISRSLWKTCCAPGTAESWSCSEHVCGQTALLTTQNRALRWAKSPPESAAGLGSYVNVSVQSRVV